MYSFSSHVRNSATGWAFCGKTGAAVVFVEGSEEPTCKACKKFSGGLSKEVLDRRELRPYGEKK